MSEWQPIETAPMYRRILVFRPPNKYAHTIDFYEICVAKFRVCKDGKKRLFPIGDWEYAPDDFSHWMPLPAPPEQQP